MNTFKHTQAGSAALIVLVVVVAVGLIGFLGYTFYTNSQKQTVSDTQSQSSSVDDVKSAPEINSEEDLDSAITVLDETDPASASDNAKLESQTSGF